MRIKWVLFLVVISILTTGCMLKRSVVPVPTVETGIAQPVVAAPEPATQAVQTQQAAPVTHINTLTDDNTVWWVIGFGAFVIYLFGIVSSPFVLNGLGKLMPKMDDGRR